MYIILHEFCPESQSQTNAGGKTEMRRETANVLGSLVAALLQLLDQRDSISKENLTIIIFPTYRSRSTLATEKIQ